MNIKTFVLAGVVALSCAVIGLGALGGSTTADVPIEKLASSRDRVQVYGKLDKSSIRQLRGYNLVSFDLLEEKKEKLTGRRVSVIYDNPGAGLPANFPTASHARCTGVYDPTQGKLVADTVYTKCPSKYKEEDVDAATRAAMDKWQKGNAPAAATN